MIRVADCLLFLFQPVLEEIFSSGEAIPSFQFLRLSPLARVRVGRWRREHTRWSGGGGTRDACGGSQNPSAVSDALRRGLVVVRLFRVGRSPFAAPETVSGSEQQRPYPERSLRLLDAPCSVFDWD